MNYKVINLLQTREIRISLTRSEEELMDFIEKNFKEIPNYSAIKLCEEAYSSQATLNRVCKKLGFRGFSELKFSIEEDLKLMENSKNSYIHNTIYYIDNINFEEIDNIIKILKNNRKILLYGLGASQITAAYFQRQLLYLEFQAIMISEEKMMESFDDFIIFIISSSGETLRVKHIAKNMKELGRIVIAITKKDSSLDEIVSSSFTHNLSIDKLNVIAREQQLHMIIMINELINRFQIG